MIKPLVSHHVHPVKPAYRFAVIGGDGRMTYVADYLRAAGCSVTLFGSGSEHLPREGGEGQIRVVTSMEKVMETADVLILPLPATRDGTTVWCPRDPSAHVTFDTLAALMDRYPHARLFGGRLPERFKNHLGASSDIPLRVMDYYDDEALQLRNAYLTAEAAVMTAMRETDCALRGSTVGIIGYGRIGRLLARLLLLLGADVTVAARRNDARLHAESDGCHPVCLGDEQRAGGGMFPLCCEHGVIFNTVPARVLDRDLLLRMEKGTILIDLASAPFGVSDEDVRIAAEENALRYIRVPSLPGSYAPRDAGFIIAACVLDALAKGGGSLSDRGVTHSASVTSRGGDTK